MCRGIGSGRIPDVVHATRPHSEQVLRVMTLNTLYRPPVEHRWREIAAWVDAEQPDVVYLQEVEEQPDGSTVADWLASNLAGS